MKMLTPADVAKLKAKKQPKKAPTRSSNGTVLNRQHTGAWLRSYAELLAAEHTLREAHRVRANTRSDRSSDHSNVS